jgi:hypothetical protein
MFDRLVERFCEFDDFCKAIRTAWEAYLVADGPNTTSLSLDRERLDGRYGGA